MPNIIKDIPATEHIVNLLDLQPGDIIITEAPYEDAKITELKPLGTKKSLTTFDPSHVSIYTGDFIKPFAHSVREGYKLPGLRLTKIWDGRHIVFRFKDAELACKIAEIARRWALSEIMYDIERFEATYQERFLGEQYHQYKKQFFSLPKAIINGPATPYSVSRAAAQLSDRCRNAKIKDFNHDSIRRAIKFATRSELFGNVSKGLRCTSFVVSVVQAASLHPIVNTCDAKFSFKNFKDNNLPEMANKFFKKNWKETPLGKKIMESYNSQNFSAIFPEGFLIDSKYAIPLDLLNALKKSLQWEMVGTFVTFKDQLLYCNDIVNNESLFKKEKTVLPKLVSPKKGVIVRPRTAIIHALRKLQEEQSDLAKQLEQEKCKNNRLKHLSTPPRNAPQSPRFTEDENGRRVSAAKNITSLLL